MLFYTCNSSERFGLDWMGLDWTGWDWAGLDGKGLDWMGLRVHRQLTIVGFVLGKEQEHRSSHVSCNTVL